ncbi:hypothetical protein CAOG_009430 [Capsaspora owczarzaki ATCC 30864]|uniref:Uncharacterized protein n=1 Tax=Capsaspora owczarzaki (strain ATCC 30864) TaxID=595528 RepID=A0A0D2WKK4_CAPO3|nr:hypothetical protein CAOG_009430 [Capsaspora owczarzaki ATCC 30864]
MRDRVLKIALAAFTVAATAGTVVAVYVWFGRAARRLTESRDTALRELSEVRQQLEQQRRLEHAQAQAQEQHEAAAAGGGDSHTAATFVSMNHQLQAQVADPSPALSSACTPFPPLGSPAQWPSIVTFVQLNSLQ